MHSEGGIKRSLEELLPQANPMILLSDYEQPQGNGSPVRAYVDIAGGSPFFENELGGVPSCVVLEYMAQAMALYTGLERLREGERPRVGFILGSRKIDISIPVFKQGCRYRIEVLCSFSDETFASFDCSVYSPSGEKVACGVLSAFCPDGELTPQKLEEFK